MGPSHSLTNAPPSYLNHHTTRPDPVLLGLPVPGGTVLLPKVDINKDQADCSPARSPASRKDPECVHLLRPLWCSWVQPAPSGFPPARTRRSVRRMVPMPVVSMRRGQAPTVSQFS